MLQSVTIDDLCLYCQVSGESGRKLTESLAQAHEEELQAAGISITERNRERYALAVKAMTLHELDHPGENRPQGIKSMIAGLKYGGR